MDLDGDGNIDLLSGSWPGEIFFFKGGPKRTFAAPIKLKNKLGKTINVDGGFRKESQGDYLLVAGDARYERKGDKRFIVYDDEWIEVPDGKQTGITGTASAVHAVDWDGDGDLDLIVGNIGGGVFLILNEGSATNYAFGKEQKLNAGGSPITVPHGDAGPFTADWDGDGKLDLLAGAGDGSVSFYRNIGTAKIPELAKGVQLVPPGKAEFGADAPKEPTRGIRAKICVTDWNGDGRLDLLVGDFTTQKPVRPDPTPEQKAEHDKLRKELTVVQKTWSELLARTSDPKAPKTGEERTKLQEELSQVQGRLQRLHSKLPQEYENHGWVWLFLRQPAGAKAAEACAQEAEKKFTFINLQAKANQKLTDNFGTGREGNNLSELPRGEQVLEGVRFNIEEGLLQLGGPFLKVPQPNNLEGIELGKTFGKLHILHGTGYGGGEEDDPKFVKDGTRIGEYRLHYEDKKTEVIPIVYGEDVRDWFNWDKSKETTRGKVAWKGENALTKSADITLRLYLCTWTNPRPDVRVVSIDYVKVGESVAAPFCVAMSLAGK